MRILLATLLIFIFASSNLSAQQPDRPNALAIKKLWIDYNTPVEGRIADFGTYDHGIELTYLRNIHRFVNIGLPLKIGVVQLPDSINNTSIASLDAIFQFQYYSENAFLVPYVLIGIGGVLEDWDPSNFQVPLGVGFRFRLGRFGYINLQSEFRKSIGKDRDNFQHGLGLGFLLGKFKEGEIPPEIEFGNAIKNDMDGDGVTDSEDACPDQAGIMALAGCPDVDGDGVADIHDLCPLSAGIRIFNGCPDTDGDGVGDNEDDCPGTPGLIDKKGCPPADRDNDGVENDVDECPDEAGTINGCPDSDRDGVADYADRCPALPGLAEFNGCPDTDGDGIEDALDRCPNTVGPKSTNGCPGVGLDNEEQKILAEAMQAVQFQSGSTKLKTESFPILDQVIGLLNRYPKAKLRIEGHTDNTGLSSANLDLSTRRAESCYKYFVQQGVVPTRIIYAGYGDSRPIADNTTNFGRQLNRRVEFKVF